MSVVKYSIALTATIEHLPPALHLALLLNRAQAYLFNGKPGSAYRDCLAARIFMDEHPDVVQPHHRERLAVRSAQAAYDMRLYDRAGRFVQECNQLGVKQGALLEEMIKARQREAKEGSYNWETMFEASIEKNAPFLDVADYTGSVTVARIPAKGRGLITTQDVKAGELLLVSKALVAAYQAETPGLTVINVDFEHNLMSKTSHVTAKVKAVHQLMDNIGLGKMFDSLQAGTSGSCHLSSPVVTEDQQLSALLQPYNVDPARLEGILNDNAFGFMQLSKQANTFHPERGNDTTDTPTRLFGLPSLMNHSCIPNTSSFSLGDVGRRASVLSLIVRSWSSAPCMTFKRAQRSPQVTSLAMSRLRPDSTKAPSGLSSAIANCAPTTPRKTTAEGRRCCWQSSPHSWIGPGRSSIRSRSRARSWRVSSPVRISNASHVGWMKPTVFDGWPQSLTRTKCGACSQTISRIAMWGAPLR